MKGVVKWFSNAKGFGFIECEQLKEDLFIHFSKIIQEGYKSLRAGDIVYFEVEKTPRGYSAINIRDSLD